VPTQAAADVAALKVKVEDAKKKARAFEAATRSPHDPMRYVLCDVLPDEDMNGPLVKDLLDGPPATRSPHDLMRYVLCDVLPDEDLNGT